MSTSQTDATPVEIRAPRGARLLEIVWSDGTTSLYEHLVLRAFCPCAYCQGHQGPVQWLDGAEELPETALELDDLFEVGSYALGMRFGDGHSTGIYTFRYLRQLAAAYDLPREQQKALVYDR